MSTVMKWLHMCG